MPATSKKQLAAMGAAASGNSTLGIPPSVGQDFVAATPPGAKLPQKAPAPKAPPSKGAKKGKDFSFAKKK